MSRFPEASVACLKQVMLSRAPEFFLKEEDVTAIMLKTALNAAQVRVWGENFRMRYATEKERMDFLTSDCSEKESSSRVTRCFVSCFNVSPEFATTFKFPKSKGNGEFLVKYMETAFNKEAVSGEFFVEFEDYIWSHKLIKCFQSQGASQVMLCTFDNLDGNESASNALLRVISSQDKTGLKYSRGTCPPALLAKVQAKQAAAKEQSSTKEFDEKTMAAIKQSMTLQEETKAAVVKVESSLQSQVVKLEGIEHGVCNVIPDYQKEIELLKQKLAHKTALCDKIEGQKAYQTREIRKQAMEIDTLKDERLIHIMEKKAWVDEKAILMEQVDLCKAITQAKQMTEAAQETTAILSSIIESKRDCKRQRGV